MLANKFFISPYKNLFTVSPYLPLALHQPKNIEDVFKSSEKMIA